LQRGLEATGQETRIDVLGTPELPLSMLRVRCPQRGLEAAEQWLFDLIQPFVEREEGWADDIDTLLHQRWPECIVWTGSAAACKEVERQLEFSGSPSRRAFVGSRYSVGTGSIHEVGVFPRAAVEVVLRLRSGAAQQPAGDPQSWVALAALPTTDVAKLQAEAQRNERMGLRTWLCELPSSTPPRTLLAVHDDGCTLEQLDARGFGVELPTIWVHRCSNREAMRLFRRLRPMLRDAQLYCSWHPQIADSGLIGCRLDRVDDVLAALRAEG
jgi:hypothetical protein